MKLTIPASELSTAVKEYLQRTYSLYGEVTIQELHEVEVDIHPRTIESLYSSSVVKERVEDYSEYSEREDAINRADHLGIKYRSDISTDKLIERIEEHEEEVLRLATEENENFPEEPMSDGNELPLEDDEHVVGELHAGNVGELKVESDEPVKEVKSDEPTEAEETQPEKKKKSIFAKD